MFRYKYLFFAFILLQLVPVLAQNRARKELDSLEVAFASIDSDTTEIVKTGKAILKISTSYRQKFEVLEKMAETYFRFNNINKSISYSFQAKDVAEQSADPEMIAQAYGSIANQYSYLNLTEKARPYLNKAVAKIETLPPGDKKFRLKALSYLELGNLDMNDKNFASANKNYRQSLAQFKRVKYIDDTNKYHYRRSLYNIGNSYYYLKQTDSAEIYLNEALSYSDSKNPTLKYYIYSTLAEVYTLRGNYKQAIDTLQTILKDPDFDINPLKVEIYLNLSRNYKNAGDKTNYTLYNEKHLALRDSVEGHERKAISTAFNVEQKDFSNSISESRKHNQWLMFGILAVILLSLATFIYLNRKKRKQREMYLSVIQNLKSEVEISRQTDISEPEIKPNYSIPQAVEKEILNGLQKFEEGERFRNTKLNISMLAVELGTNPAYLSAVIKAHKDQNFNSYVNELRIRYICRKIHTHREYVNYKISYLAEDCGFTSHSTFSTIFKKVTGISPSVFLSEEEKSHNEKTGA